MITPIFLPSLTPIGGGGGNPFRLFLILLIVIYLICVPIMFIRVISMGDEITFFNLTHWHVVHYYDSTYVVALEFIVICSVTGIGIVGLLYWVVSKALQKVWPEN